MPRRTLVLSLLLTGIGCATSTRRDLSDVRPETRIRVTHNSAACCASPVVGTLVNYDADSVRVRVPSQELPIAIPRASITWMESAHSAGRGGRGALMGLGFGTVGGAIIGLAKMSCKTCANDLRGVGLVFGAGAGAIVGTLAGLFTGLGIRRDVWDTVLP